MTTLKTLLGEINLKLIKLKKKKIFCTNVYYKINKLIKGNNVIKVQY